MPESPPILFYNACVKAGPCVAATLLLRRSGTAKRQASNAKHAKRQPFFFRSAVFSTGNASLDFRMMLRNPDQ